MRVVRYIFSGAYLFCLLIAPSYVVFAQQEQGMLISEVQTASSTSAADEFIELYNPTDQNIDLAGWSIEYKSASSTDWNNPSRTIILQGIVAPRSAYLVASAGYLTDLHPHATFTAGLAVGGGHLRLIKTETMASSQIVTEYDMVGWGNAAMRIVEGQSLAVTAPAAGESISRVLNDALLPQDTDVDNVDFVVGAPDPQNSDLIIPDLTDDEEDVSEEDQADDGEGTTEEEPEEEEPSEEEQIEEDTEVVQNAGLLPPQITELLPDPASPATDENDEFVELFNPNTEFFDLSGYTLQTGNSFNYKHTFPDGTLIAPSAYLVVYSKDSNITLSNSGSSARLVDPEGIAITTITPYTNEDIEAGSSWLLIAGTWQWSMTPTPALPNILALPSPKAVKALTTKSSTKKATAKKSSAKKTSTTKKAATTTKKANTDNDERVVFEDPESLNESTPIHPLVLATVGLSTVGYGIYEYRFEIQRKFDQLRRYLASRRTARS